MNAPLDQTVILSLNHNVGAGRRHPDNNSDDDGSVDDSGEILSFGSSEEEELSKADETHENASDESFIESREDMDDENDF